MVDNNKKDIRDINKRFAKAFQKIGIVKYDAYQQLGGLLSFSLALLDEDNNGLILNSVHSTEGCYTYVKEIKAGICDIELSKEEKTALSHRSETTPLFKTTPLPISIYITVILRMAKPDEGSPAPKTAVLRGILRLADVQINV